LTEYKQHKQLNHKIKSKHEMKKVLLFLFLAINMVAWSQQNAPLPIDPDVRKGTLENGLTYYIRHNNLPENRADFYLAQKAGSILEEDNEAGLAHFLEHMAFNGTKNFPGKSMLDYLEKNGVKFGTNVNAYTSFDETVYYLTNVPMVREGLLDSCLLILHDWSNALLLETEEIEKERGVIREEWRTRGGAQSRILEKLLPEMYKGSKYANRLPIGKIEVIENFKPDELRAFYHKWYRPDLQGIIVVGNVDVDKVETKIKHLFSPINLDPNRPKREYFPVPDNDDPIVATATDPEATRINLMVFYKHDPVPDEIKLSQAGLIINYIDDVAGQMINERLQEIIHKPDAPFTSAYAYNGNYYIAKTKDAWTVVGNAAEDKIKDALAAMIRETERMKRFGFTPSEYERARENLLKSYENAYNNRDKQRNTSYTAEYLRNFLNSEPIPGIEYEYETMQTIASQIPVEVINQTVAQLINDKNLVISVSGPDKEEIAYPKKDELVALSNEVKAEKIEPYQEEVSNEPLVPNPPAPGKIVKTEKDEKLGTTVWTLENGMKVVLKSTDFKNDEILMTASSEGGTSIYAEEDPLNSKMMNQVMTLGGVGNFSVTNLRKVLAGKRASASPSIGLITQGMNGSSSIQDFETMLQLVYLYFTAPRSDEEAFVSYIKRVETQLKNQEVDPMVAFSDSVTYALYGDNPMTKRLKVEDLPNIDYEKIMKMYKQSFSNPGSFTFSFVGNIDEEKVKPIIEQYLASLPGTPEKTEFKQIPMDYRKGIIHNLFERQMQIPKASVFNGITGSIDFEQRNQMLMSIFGQILDIVYTEKIREEEGGTYGVYAGGGISRYPKNQSLMQIMYDTDPAKMEKMNAIVLDELQSIADNGPREADFSKVKEFMRKKYYENIKENGYWLNILNNYYFYGDDNYSDYLKILESFTPNDVKTFVKEFLSQNNRATVIMMPKE